MSASLRLKQVTKRAIRRRGFILRRLTDQEREFFERVDRRDRDDTPASVFGPSLGRLEELRRRYADVQLPIAAHSIWATRRTSDRSVDIGWVGVDLAHFRGSPAYVWDYGTTNVEADNLKYFLFAKAVQQKDDLKLLTTLTEDGAFGCATFEYAGVGRVSRDLLDSVAEINFLDRHLSLMERDDLRVLDIGAGYGRMAHRMLAAHPGIESYTCVDSVPESTFLCEFYLGHRGLGEQAAVVPLDELDDRLQPEQRYNLAMNIHSFSECTYAAIEWWLRRVRELGVRHLFIVPNDPTRFVSLEVDHSQRDYAPLLKELGFRLVAQEPLFEDPEVQKLIGVRDILYLFELS